MAISLLDARQLSEEVLQALRLRALHGCQLGYSERKIDALLGVAHETVCRCWSAFVAGCIDPLPPERSARPGGSGRSLSNEQAQHIQELLDKHNPEELQIASPLWTRGAVGESIDRRETHG